MEEYSSGCGQLTEYSEHGDGFNVALFPCNYIKYIKI